MLSENCSIGRVAPTDPPEPTKNTGLYESSLPNCGISSFTLIFTLDGEYCRRAMTAQPRSDGPVAVSSSKRGWFALFLIALIIGSSQY